MGYERLNDGIIETMKELRANGWSIAGITSVYRRWGVTEASVRHLVGEREEVTREEHSSHSATP